MSMITVMLNAQIAKVISLRRPSTCHKSLNKFLRLKIIQPQLRQWTLSQCLSQDNKYPFKCLVRQTSESIHKQWLAVPSFQACSHQSARPLPGEWVQMVVSHSRWLFPWDPMACSRSMVDLNQWLKSKIPSLTTLEVGSSEILTAWWVAYLASKETSHNHNPNNSSLITEETCLKSSLMAREWEVCLWVEVHSSSMEWDQMVNLKAKASLKKFKEICPRSQKTKRQTATFVLKKSRKEKRAVCFHVIIASIELASKLGSVTMIPVQSAERKLKPSQMPNLSRRTIQAGFSETD